MSRTTMVLVGLIGITMIFMGARQLWWGISTLGESWLPDRVRVKLLIRQGNAALDEANRQTVEGGPKLKELLDELNKSGLVPVREGQRPRIEEVERLFRASSENYLEASRKLAEARALASEGDLGHYLSLKSEAYERFASTKARVRRLVLHVLDPTVTDTGSLASLLEPINQAIEADWRRGIELADQADSLAKEKHLFGQ